MAEAKGHLLAACKAGGLDTRSASWDGRPCAGLPEAPKHPLVGRPAKANHRFLELETQSGPNLAWHRAEETAFYLSLGKKKEPRG